MTSGSGEPADDRLRRYRDKRGRTLEEVAMKSRDEG
jgi:hypothetical protein